MKAVKKQGFVFRDASRDLTENILLVSCEFGDQLFVLVEDLQYTDVFGQCDTQSVRHTDTGGQIREETEELPAVVAPLCDNLLDLSHPIPGHGQFRGLILLHIGQTGNIFFRLPAAFGVEIIEAYGVKLHQSIPVSSLFPADPVRDQLLHLQIFLFSG